MRTKKVRERVNTVARAAKEMEVDMIRARRGGTAPRRVARWSVLAGIALAAVLLAAPAPQALAGKPLSGGFTIADGAQFTNDNDIVLVSVVRAALQMRFKNLDGTYSTWEPYARSKDWQLSPGDGVKTVEGQYKGSTGARLTVVDDITLDTTGPVTTAEYGTLVGRSVSIMLSPVDALSGVTGTWFRIDGGEWREGTSVSLWLQRKRSGAFSAGAHTVDYYSIDGIGNAGGIERLIVTLE